MSFLGQIVWGFFKALLGLFQRNAETPATMKDANTPPKVLDEFQDSVDDYIARKDREDKSK